ncbi:MAG TPA: fumarylacetoacetate hydrolase family protein [Casimicrobiaceae bacterium]|jgi:2-keto-4-pentenoate hydratase|nr:fumarylacetoacetate hydrolase family protein [Casimicrobiaceae bacterium]
MTDASDRLADLLVRARREHRLLSADETGAGPATLDDAYRVQDRVAEALGWFRGAHPTTWKVGAAQRGATPSATPLPPEGVVTSPAQFDAARFHGIGIEAEVAFRFATAPLEAERPEDVLGAVGELVVTIEVVDARLVDAAVAPALLKLADAQMHGALVVGTGVPYRAVDWDTLHVTVQRNGATIHDARGGHALVDPSVLLPWFVRHVAARSGGVRAGDLVTAGTWVGILPARRGDTIEVAFGGIGRAVVRFG